MPEFLLSPEARADVSAQWDYFAEVVRDIDVADRFLSSAEQTFKALARTPGLGRLTKFSCDSLKELRSWRIEGFPKFIIFYRLIQNGKGIEIVRVLHGMRDLEAILGRGMDM